MQAPYKTNIDHGLMPIECLSALEHGIAENILENVSFLFNERKDKHSKHSSTDQGGLFEKGTGSFI
tara:strand:+ start:970 stop:1167 length:198 start_codon:yes stop_codon:yes gene_type:complete